MIESFLESVREADDQTAGLYDRLRKLGVEDNFAAFLEADFETVYAFFAQRDKYALKEDQTGEFGRKVRFEHESSSRVNLYGFIPMDLTTAHQRVQEPRFEISLLLNMRTDKQNGLDPLHSLGDLIKSREIAYFFPLSGQKSAEGGVYSENVHFVG